MYIVKYGNQYIHDPFSDTQRAYDVHISSDINASGTCEFTIGPSHPLYNKLELRSSSNNVTVLEDDTVLFDGYIYSFSTNYDNSRDVTCYGCLSYLGDIRLRPYATQQSDDDPPDMLYCSSTIDGLFEFYIDQYNKYAEEGRKFHMGTNEGSVIRELNSISASSDSYPTVADELSDKLLDTVGGYVFIHHDGTDRYIDYFANCTDVNAQIVDFGVNIIDFVKTDTMSGFYTALRPVGGTPSESEKETENPKRFPISLNLINDGPTDVTGIVKKGDVVYNEDAVTKYGYVEGYQSYSEITDVAALQHQAAIDIKIASSIHPTIEVKAIDLALYKQGNEPLVPGQLVRVRSIPHGIDEYLLLNNMDIDISDPSNTVYTFGEAIDSLTGEQNKKAAELNASINHSLDSVAELDQTIKDQAIQIDKVENVANDASDKADQAQDTADSNKQEIDHIKDQQSEQDKIIQQMQQGVADSEKEIGAINDRIEGMNSEIESAKSDIDSLRSSTETELQNVKQSVSDVQSDVDAVTQKAEDLASDLDGTKATVEQVTTELGEVKTTVSNAASKADQALQVSTTASQTATEAKTTATSAYQDAQSALTQSSTASQTANAVKTELETNYSTTDEIAEQYATKSLVEQTSQSITSTVEATYATKATVEGLENIANNAVQTWMGSGVPTLSNKPASDWNTAELKSQHSGDIYYDSDTGYSYRFGSSDGSNYSWSLIKDTDITKAVADAAKAQQTAEGVSDEVTQLKTDIPATYATKTEVKQTTDSIKSSVSEVATTANSALTKATTVEQTANGLQTTVTEQAEKLDSAVTTISQVSQKVDSVSSTITQVSGRVDDVEDKADAATSTADSALSQSSTVQQELTSFKTSVQQTYETKDDALSKQSSLQQSVNNLRTEVSETYLTKTSAQQTYSTKSYVDQTARTVSLGVVEEYKNGEHGSALATQADITAAKDSITSTVSQTYATKAEVETTYATKTEVKQTSDSLTVTISSAVSKAESAVEAATDAQNTANAANTTANTANTNAANARLDATNANNRVGNLETCIKMTSDGVRVGKISNGNFTGYSALVNSAGSFDILDSSSNPVTSFQQNKVQFYSNGSKFGEMDLVRDHLQFGIRTEGSDQAWASALVLSSSYLGLSSDYGPINMVAKSGITIVGDAGPVEINGDRITLFSPTTLRGGTTVLSGSYLSIANNATLRFVHSQVKDIIHGSTVITGNGTSHRQVLSSSQVNSYGGYREGDFFQAWNGDYSANSSTIKGTSYHNGGFYVDFDTNMQGAYRVNWTWIKYSN